MSEIQRTKETLGAAFAGTHIEALSCDQTRRSAVITGGAGSLGVAVTAALLRENYRIVLIDSDKDRLRRSTADLTCLGDVTGLHADVGEYEPLRQCFEKANKVLDGINLLVCCARMTYEGEVREISLDQWHRVINTNLTGSMYSSVLASDYMIGQDDACIVHMADIYSRIGSGAHGAVSAAAAGIVAMSRSLAADLESSGVRCVSISPFTVMTDSRRKKDQVDPHWREIQEEAVLDQRILKPEEVADVVRFVGSGQGSTLNAVDIAVDGGMSVFRERPMASPYVNV